MKKITFYTIAVIFLLGVISLIFDQNNDSNSDLNVAFNKTKKGTVKESKEGPKHEATEKSNNPTDQETILLQRLSYLNDVEEIAWFEVDNNDVYIGFDPLPSDWKLIIQSAAIHGNNVINFGCHVWAVKGSERGWRPSNGPHYGNVTARHGKIE
jgi:hypothetical protein